MQFLCNCLTSQTLLHCFPDYPFIFSYLSFDDSKKWVKKIVKLAYSNPKYIELGKEFATAKITIIKDIEIFFNDVIAICIEKNDLIKLKKFISHHRKIGVNKFIILDNESNDGTVEWLLKQEDVILLQTKTPYSSIRRVAWINRIIAHYGYNRWYIVLDSDELLVYNNYENKSIKDVVKYFENKNIVRARSLMLEMYAKDEYYESGDINKFYDECIYFDTDTYFLKKREEFINISGGPRKRVFDISTCLTKYPLFYFRKNDVICSSHFIYPYKDNLNIDCSLIVKHYKFLPGEIKKYREIVKKENYYNRSFAYKKIISVIDKTKKLNFIYDNSCKYQNSKSLDILTLYKKINWDSNN